MEKKLCHASGLAFVITIALSSSNTFAAGDENTTKDFGEATLPTTAARTIAINHYTNWVEVKDGETVNFTKDGQTFAWHFDGINTLSEIDLNKIAPTGMLHHLVKVYIDRTPAYDGA